MIMLILFAKILTIFFVLGSENNNEQARIEKRLNEDGKLIKHWNLNLTVFNDLFTDCIILNDKLFVVGLFGSIWYYLILDLDLNLIKIQRGRTGFFEPNLILNYGNYLYISGKVKGYPENKWIVEKRDINLKMIKEYVSNLTDITIGINPLTKNIWIVGYKKEEYKLKIEILDNDLNYLKTIYTEKFTNSYNLITFNKEGYAYVATTSGYLVKFDKNGNLVKNPDKITFGGRIIISKILAIENYIFLVSQLINPEGIINHVIIVLDEEFQEIKRLTVATNVMTFVDKGKIVNNRTRIYSIGNYYKSNNDSEWVIYSLNLTSFITKIASDDYQYWIFHALIFSLLIISGAILWMLLKIRKLNKTYFFISFANLDLKIKVLKCLKEHYF